MWAISSLDYIPTESVLHTWMYYPNVTHPQFSFTSLSFLQQVNDRIIDHMRWKIGWPAPDKVTAAEYLRESYTLLAAAWKRL